MGEGGMNDRTKPAFHTWERANLDRLAHDLWDQNKELRQERERLRLEILSLRKQIVDDWK